MKYQSNVVCQKADCPMSGVCARHADYLEALASKESFTILNPEKVNDIETVIRLTRDQVQDLDLGSKAKSNYLYCGFGAILKCFAEKGESMYSQETLDACVKEAQEKFKNGEMGRSAFQNIRKTALWIKEYRNTGMITHHRLSNVEFAYTNPEYEKLLQEYREYMESESCLKEKSRNEYFLAVRRFFRNLEELGCYEYQKLGLADITECISKIARETRCAIFSTLNAMRSPDITPALNCVPAKHRRVYEGYTDEEAQKILNSIDRESVQGKRDYAMIMIANDTGLRGIDILSLKFSSIDWDKRELRIVQEKTGKPLALPFDTLTGNAIADYILNARPECDSEYVFIRLSRPYTRLRSMWTIVAHYAHSALGETNKMNGPHAFRRGMGRRLIEAGIPTSTVCDIMGHTSTMSILQYTSASVESLRQCCRTLEEIPVEQEGLL